MLVFSRTKHGADRIARILTKAGIEGRAIHGDKSQGARERAMNDFRSGACRVLIATDIAARGIDISELPLVINYDLPEVPETYGPPHRRTDAPDAPDRPSPFARRRNARC